jgi:5-methylcytosine-specific restriction enzyme subunit McrC
MVPFVVDMARLFERFVAQWLATALGQGFQVASQVRTPLGGRSELHFAIDLVVRDAQGRARWVLDTKYKTPAAGPEPADVAQVLAYAQVQGAPEAVLVYPAPPAQPLDAWVNEVRVRTLAFRLDGDLEGAGTAFLAALRQA